MLEKNIRHVTTYLPWHLQHLRRRRTCRGKRKNAAWTSSHILSFNGERKKENKTRERGEEPLKKIKMMALWLRTKKKVKNNKEELRQTKNMKMKNNKEEWRHFFIWAVLYKPYKLLLGLYMSSSNPRITLNKYWKSFNKKNIEG